MLKHFDGIQIGLTATPCVASPEVLAALADEEDTAFIRDTLRFFEVDRPTYRYTLKQAIQEGSCPLSDLQGHDGQDRRRGWLPG